MAARAYTAGEGIVSAGAVTQHGQPQGSFTIIDQPATVWDQQSVDAVVVTGDDEVTVSGQLRGDHAVAPHRTRHPRRHLLTPLRDNLSD